MSDYVISVLTRKLAEKHYRGRIFFILMTALIFLRAVCAAWAEEEKSIVRVKGGDFLPMYSSDNIARRISVGSFRLDSNPVTNGDFYEFMSKSPDWFARVRQQKFVSDGNLLKHWKECGRSLCPPEGELNKPVVNVSWFVAEDYCCWKGGRLPTVIEWEYAAAASENNQNGAAEPLFYSKQLDWYSKPALPESDLPDVRSSKPNYWGIYDLHGLVWEWTADFNSVFVSGDNRSEGDNLKDAFCGAGAASASDKANYAAFIRYAMRNSLKGNYTTKGLGFRCAYD